MFKSSLYFWAQLDELIYVGVSRVHSHFQDLNVSV